MDYLVLSDGAAVCALEVKWASGPQWKVRLCLDFYTSSCHVIWEKWNHAIAACLCLWYVSHSEGGRARQSGAVFRECIGTNSTDIKVGVCFFPAQRSSSFIPVCDLRSVSHWTRSKQADEEGTPCLPSFKSINHRRPLSPFWQISTSSSIGCGILLSVSLWHGREGRTQVPRCCNYITTSLAAPWPLTQLFLENINFIVSFERMWSLSQNKSSVEGWGSGSSVRCMHASENT